MRKVLAALLILCLSASLFAGCGSGSNQSGGGAATQAPAESSSSDSSSSETTKAAETTKEEDEPEVVVVADDEPEIYEEPALMSGTVTISTQSGVGAEEAWTAVANGYMALNPGVNVVVDLKPGDGYPEWLAAMFNSADPVADIVNINLAHQAAAGKDINYYEYINKISPYSGMPWKDQFNFALQGGKDDARGTWNNLSLESVQVRWFYNQEIFDEVGVQAPRTWDEFVEVCEKLDAAGYQALAVPGTFNSFWAMQMGWLVQFYADQVTRDYVNITRAQPGDYCYDPDVDGVWTYNPMDPHNDDAAYLNQNAVRYAKALKDGEIRGDAEGFKFFMNQIARLFPRYAGGDAFFGTEDYNPIFYQWKAAIILDGGWRFSNFMIDMEKLASGEDLTTGSGDDEVVIEGVKPFTLGSFNNPSMSGPEIQAPARTIEVAVGFYGAVKKDKDHDDMVVDFLMYLSSDEGYGKYLTALLENGGGVAGPPLVYGVELPPKYAQLFEGIEFIGNCQKGYGGTLSRGAPGDVQESLRDWYQYTQDFLNGRINVDEWANQHQANIEKYYPVWMSNSKILESDLDNPQNEPSGE